VPERPKGTGCKPVGSAYGGSNPPAPILARKSAISGRFCASFEGTEALRAQVPLARVTGGIVTFLDLAVAGEVPASTFRDGPIPGRAFVEDADGEYEGEVLVWVADGYLSGLEFASVTDEWPTGMPEADRVRVVLES
jgi:hypothetical protein